MAYWLDEGWHNWPEVMEVGTAAAGLYSRCGSYVADRGTDGFVPSAVARAYGTPEWVARLVDVGLWSAVDGGFRDERYFPLNKTQEQIEEAKAAHRRRQAAYQTRKTRHSRSNDASADASVTRPPIPPPTGDRGGRAALRPVPDWCGRCHRDTRLDVDDTDRSIPCPRCHPERRAS